MSSPEREEYCEKLADVLYKADTLIDFMSFEHLIPEEIARELRDTIENIAHKADAFRSIYVDAVVNVEDIFLKEFAKCICEDLEKHEC
jgi:predicted nucleic acid-binding protein